MDRNSALWETPMAVGFQLIHAFLSFEGVSRSWCNPSFGEPDADLINWRLSAKGVTDDDIEEGDTMTL